MQKDSGCHSGIGQIKTYESENGQRRKGKSTSMHTTRGPGPQLFSRAWLRLTYNLWYGGSILAWLSRFR